MTGSSAAEHPSVPLGAGFPHAEMERLSACLARLLPREAIADLDMVAGSLGAVSANVVEDFLVSHYHVVQPGVPKFMVQLVDPVTRIRVDIFPDLVGSLTRSSRVKIGKHLPRMLALEDVFEHKLLTISKASPTNPIDPKHADDAYALGKLLQRSIPAVAHGSLIKDVYGTDDLGCGRCELSSSASFPLAPTNEIFRLLGWTHAPSLGR
jgi:hypothetical protein